MEHYITVETLLEQIDTAINTEQESLFMTLEAKQKGIRTIGIDQYEWLLNDMIRRNQVVREVLTRDERLNLSQGSK